MLMYWCTTLNGITYGEGRHKLLKYKKKLGFLSTEDAEAPGNYGLLDQTMALR